MVVQEDSKFEPLMAAIAGGLCTHLVVGARMAERLLEHVERDRKGLLDRHNPCRRPLSSKRRDTGHSNQRQGADEAMKNLWNDGDAEEMVADYAKKGVSRDLALRVYTTRLLGGEPRLVLHGGGNTSVQDQGHRSRRRRMGCALRQGQRLGHGRDRAAGPAGGQDGRHS